MNKHKKYIQNECNNMCRYCKYQYFCDDVVRTAVLNSNCRDGYERRKKAIDSIGDSEFEKIKEKTMYAHMIRYDDVSNIITKEFTAIEYNDEICMSEASNYLPFVPENINEIETCYTTTCDAETYYMISDTADTFNFISKFCDCKLELIKELRVQIDSIFSEIDTIKEKYSNTTNEIDFNDSDEVVEEEYYEAYDVD